MWWQQHLNQEQIGPVTSQDQAILVFAGPGSGKTRVLIYRIAHLLRDCDVAPRQIVALTFTNKAAAEMQHRMRSLLEDDPQSLMIGTFHSVCVRWLRKHGERIGVPSSFTIWDEDDQRRAVAHLVKDLGLDPAQYPSSGIIESISLAKSMRVTPSQMAQEDNEWRVQVASVYMAYQRMLKASCALDFDEILSATMRLWKEHPATLAAFRSHYQHILVDEFQDTNLLQVHMLLTLAGRQNHLFAVGDSDQSIYGWRGAASNNVQLLQKYYPALQIFELNTNYRSTQSILNLAQTIIDGSTQRLRPRQLRSAIAEFGNAPIIMDCIHPQHEAQWIAGRILGHLKHQFKPEDVAILYRTNAQSRAIEQALIDGAIPYRIIGGTRFYDRREIKDLLAYVKLLINPKDTTSLLRVINVPTRGIGGATIAALADIAKQGDITITEAIAKTGECVWGVEPVLQRKAMQAVGHWMDLQQRLQQLVGTVSAADILRAICDQIGYKAFLLRKRRGESEAATDLATTTTENATEKDADSGDGLDRWNNVEECIAYAETFSSLPLQEQLPKMLESISLLAAEARQDGSGAVRCMSLHQAKGMEFPIVFISGVVEGTLPHTRNRNVDLEEERRLLYVGVTRAAQYLYLVWYASSRDYSGQSRDHVISRFLST